MSDQMSAEDVVATQEIASLRIHVERAINMVKNFLIFDGVIPLTQFQVIYQMWCVCAMLCNIFQGQKKRNCLEQELLLIVGSISSQSNQKIKFTQAY